jgi:bifunctional enzyme CysN/CysC
MTNTTPLHIVVVGHVDHGKSTLVGRLLHDTGSLPDGKVEAVRAASARRGVPFEWAFLLDALQAERDQGITIDTTRIRLKTPGRDTVVIDAPGHKEFLKNMISGAANADAALLVVDAVEGVREQTRRHAYLLHLLGLRQVVVAVNKMDAVGWDAARFVAVKAEIEGYLAGIGVPSGAVIPISAREGANVAARTGAAPWHDGPTVVEALAGLAPAANPAEMPLRFPVQDVLKLDERRIVIGRIESGRLKVGDSLLFSPSGKTARVASIEGWKAAPTIAAGAGQAVGITLDDHIFVERGHVASPPTAAPTETTAVRARVFWLGAAPLAVGNRYRLRLATAEYQVEVAAVDKAIDVESLAAGSATEIGRNGVAEVVLRSRGLMALDRFADNPRTGRFVLVDGHDVAGGGIVIGDGVEEGRARRPVKSANLFPVGHRVAPETRWIVNAHKGAVIWLTGLSAAGKSTIAMEVEQHLVRRGRQAFVLDGDNVRQGLNADLGFSPEDRTENIRRVGEVAHLFAQAGMIVITAFISPYRADRDRVRAINPAAFHEVFVHAELGECRRRDPKGLYAKALKGEIPEFTGVSAPYEAPLTPELVIDTSGRNAAHSAAELLAYIERTLAHAAAPFLQAAGE